MTFWTNAPLLVLALKVITVANEKKEAELVAQINILQHEVDRLHVVDSERNDFNQRMQAA